MVGVVASFAYLSRDVKPSYGNFMAKPMTDIEVEFQKHINEHGRSFATKEEYYYRLGVFTQIYNQIQRHNAKFAEEMGFTMALNQFSDMTEAEFKKHLGYIPNNDYPEEVSDEEDELDTPVQASVDWVASGAVTPVKD